MIALKNTKNRWTRTWPTRSRNRPTRPKLRFSPYAWAKLLFLRDIGPSEVGGFGVTDESDPMCVIDFRLVRQHCTVATVDFCDESVADFFDQQVDQGRLPNQFARIWIHTHPGSSPAPSCTDEETFARSFSAPDWAVMFILAQQGAAYGRLKLNIDPKLSLRLRPEVDFTVEFPAADPDAWLEEYEENVICSDPFASSGLLSGYRSTGSGLPADLEHTDSDPADSDYAAADPEATPWWESPWVTS